MFWVLAVLRLKGTGCHTDTFLLLYFYFDVNSSSLDPI
jgi:hypothetical protein